MTIPCEQRGDSLFLELRIQPRASRDEVSGLHGNRFRLRITAAPVDGAANAHLIKLMARAFGVPRRQVFITRGESSREKRVRIDSPRKRPDWLERC